MSFLSMSTERMSLPGYVRSDYINKLRDIKRERRMKDSLQ